MNKIQILCVWEGRIGECFSFLDLTGYYFLGGGGMC